MDRHQNEELRSVVVTLGVLFFLLLMMFAAIGCMRGPQGAQGEPGINGSEGLDGRDGTNGVDGASGVDGSNGSSCSTLPTDTGALITCTDGSVSEIVNGVDGVDGTDGSDGADGSTYCYKQTKKKLVRIECPTE